ncbi:RHS repeat protein [Pseudoduganella violacea]|uniref:YD repeat-containing protein n=1 Tax=Pseudoduganella violacea TaxID=1715466 RepID=A0A7W5FX08_9BURK|nr:RHS repeat protein [Pseudoduganella violacea]MBB3122464.1 YD repeat-containing protein [Pseudoduganella violacea]
MTDRDAAIQEHARQFCVGNPRRLNCHGRFSQEYFETGERVWKLEGLYGFITRNPPYPDQVFEDIVDADSIYYDCPKSWSNVTLSTNPGLCSRPEQPEPDCDTCDPRVSPTAGNPILITAGIKQQVEVDYQNYLGTLSFIRTYRSDTRQWQHNHTAFGINFGRSGFDQVPPNGCLQSVSANTGEEWCYTYAGRRQANDFALRRSNGRLLRFGSSSDMLPPKDVNDRVTDIFEAGGSWAGSQVRHGQTDASEIYDRNGLLLSSTARNGQITRYTYSDTSTSQDIAPKPGLLIGVTDAFGNHLNFIYDPRSRLVKMFDPAGGVYEYAYDASGNITSVTYPDGKLKRYLYGELDRTGNTRQPFVLTGIVDENGDRYASFTYNSATRAIATEHAGGVEKYLVAYPAGSRTIVTDPLGTQRIYDHIQALGVKKMFGVTQPATGGMPAASTVASYDANGNLTGFRDFDYTTSSYAYDLSRNLEIRRTEAVGKPEARTISTEWHAQFRLPLRIAEPKLITSYGYDERGNVLSKSLQATSDTNGAASFSAAALGSPRVWRYTYSSVGQVLTIDGPRTDVNDITAYAYDSAGNLISIRNAVGHTTRFFRHDAHGRVGRMSDPNGLVTELSYTPRGWLASRSVGGELTTYSYDGVGQLVQISMADGSSLRYGYDAAHRLTGVSDNLGNSINYGLDTMGNRISEQIKDPNGVLTRQISRTYDALNRVQKVTGESP